MLMGIQFGERHRIENVHFYDIMYLPECKTYIRLHIGGIDFFRKKSLCKHYLIVDLFT